MKNENEKYKISMLWKFCYQPPAQLAEHGDGGGGGYNFQNKYNCRQVVLIFCSPF